MKNRSKRQFPVMRVMLFLSALLLFTGISKTARAASGAAVKKVVSVNSLTGSKTIKLAKGKKATLKTTVSVTPNKTANKKVTYESSNTKVATVTSKGVITGKKAGTAKIIVRPAKNKKLKAVVTVKVVKGKVTGIRLNKTSGTLAKGNTVKLKASVETSEGGSKDIAWKTSNKKIATVSRKGTVKAVGTGTATITAKAADGSGKKATYKVKVTKANGGSIAFANDTVSTLYTSCEVRIRLLCSSPQHGKVSWETSDPEVLDFVTEPGYDDVEGDNVLIYANTETWSNVIYMPCTMENNFVPEFPKETPDLIYLCLPNNPTGTTITKAQLQEWVDYASREGAVIIYDAAYEAYISEPDVAHSIYECQGAKHCAIELKSYSKNAGFTGVRLGYTVVPKELKCGEVSLNSMWARRHGTKFNGAPYIVQRAGEATYSPQGKAQLKEQVAYYMNNAAAIKNGLKEAGYTVFGGVNAPYIWLKTPDQMTSWEFFDYLLEQANVVGTPGAGFGPSGEGYFRLTAFGSYENTLAALERIRAI